MTSNFVPFAALWAVMAMVVLGLFVWRKTVSSKEDDQLHVMGGAAVSQQQTQVAQKLDQIDKWGKTLTVITVVFGLVLAAAYIYQGWVSASKIAE
jgi:hypothetical protein